MKRIMALFRHTINNLELILLNIFFYYTSVTVLFMKIRTKGPSFEKNISLFPKQHLKHLICERFYDNN